MAINKSRVHILLLLLSSLCLELGNDLFGSPKFLVQNCELVPIQLDAQQVVLAVTQVGFVVNLRRAKMLV